MKELLQQALDALAPHRSSYGNGKRPVEDAAIEGLEQALAQQEHVHGWEHHAKKLTKWVLCMSYNDSYFGEPAGLVKQVTKELSRLMGSTPANEEAQQEQPETWTRHPNPVHHTGPLSEEHLRDVVERTKAIQVALDAWVAQAQSGQPEVPCPLAFVGQEQSASVDAYVGAREDAAIWKKRALEAEELNRKFIAELNGPTYLGEPTQQEQPAQKPDLWKTQFLTDVMTAAGLLMYGRTDKKLAQRIADGSARWRTELYTHPAPTQPALLSDDVTKALEVWFSKELESKGFEVRMRAAIEAHCRGGQS